MAKPKYELDVNIATSILYHRRRQAWFERWDVLAKVLALVATGAVVSAEKVTDTGRALVSSFTFWASLLAGIITMGAVVGGANRKASQHSTLAARFVDLEAACILADENDAAVLLDIEKQYSLIKRDELPELGALIRLCQREAMRARGYEECDLPQVPSLHWVLCHWWDFQTPPDQEDKNDGEERKKEGCEEKGRKEKAAGDVAGSNPAAG